MRKSASDPFALVPRDPTAAMLQAYDDCPYEGAEDKWRAMLSAAPNTPGYQAVFNAIAGAVDKNAMGIGISVEAFWKSIGESMAVSQ